MKAVIKIIILILTLVSIISIFYLSTGLSPKKETTGQPAEVETETPPPEQVHPWNTYHGDAQLTGFSPVQLPDALAVQWRYKAGAPVRQTPVVADGRIFFATARGEITAVDFAGQRLWSQELFTGEQQQNGQPVRARIEAPLSCFESRVYAGTTRGVIHALDAESGIEIWACNIDGPVLGTINYLPSNGISAPGRLYVISRADAKLACIDASSGVILWRGESIDRCDGSPAISTDAVAYGSCAAALHIFSPETGEKLHNVGIDDDSQIAGGVAVSGGYVYAGCRSGKILQIEISSGKQIWTNADSDSEVFSTPAVAGDWITACSNSGVIYALDRATGKTRWKVETDAALSSPVIASDKVLVSADGELIILGLADGTRLGSVKISDEITSPAIAGPMVLVGSEDGTVAALGPAEQQERSARQ